MLDKSMRIEGTLQIEGDLHFSGTLIGEIKVTGKAVISQGGMVEGKLLAQEAEVAGTVLGLLAVRNTLSLRSTAEIEGDVHAKKLSVEEGAIMNADCHMNTSGSASSRSSSDSRSSVKDTAKDPSPAGA